MEIDTYTEILNDSTVRLKVNEAFFESLKEVLTKKYGSLSKYNKLSLKESSAYARQIFLTNKYLRPKHALQIIHDADLKIENLFENIDGFTSKGSKKESTTQITPRLIIDEGFVEGYALYLAEGDNGSNGFTKPKKFRLTNSNLNVIKYFMNWIEKYFPKSSYYIVYVLPTRLKLSCKHIEQVKRFLGIQVIKIALWNAKKKSDICYRVCLDSSIIINLFLKIERQVKDTVGKAANLMRAYIRGMMAGEGTVHHKGNFHYVRIEMKNKREILFLASIFEKLGFKFTCKERGTRKDMWYIYLGGKENLFKFYETIGFGAEKKRQKILEEIIEWYNNREVSTKKSIRSVPLVTINNVLNSWLIAALIAFR